MCHVALLIIFSPKMSLAFRFLDRVIALNVIIRCKYFPPYWQNCTITKLKKKLEWLMIDLGCIHPVKPPTLGVVGEIPPIQIPTIAGWPIYKIKQ